MTPGVALGEFPSIPHPKTFLAITRGVDQEIIPLQNGIFQCLELSLMDLRGIGLISPILRTWECVILQFGSFKYTFHCHQQWHKLQNIY